MAYSATLGSIPNPPQPIGPAGNRIFFQNEKTLTANYTVPENTNAGSFGPITLGSGVTVTIPASSTWTVV